MAQCAVDILGLAWFSARQREDVLELCLDLGKQLPWIRLLAERSELCEPFWREGLHGTESVEGCAHVVIPSPDLGALSRLREDRLFDDTHDRLEEVVIEPHQVVEAVDILGLLHGVQAVIAPVGTYGVGIALFDERVVVLVVGPTAGQVHLRGLLFPEASHMVIEELAAVVGMNFAHCKEQAFEN